MSYAVTPYLWVGNRFPEVSGPKTMMVEMDDPHVAVALIEEGITVVVPFTHQAKQVLRAMGLSREAVDDRIKHGMRGDL